MDQQVNKCGPCDSGKAQVGTVELKFLNEPEVSTQDSTYEMLLEVIGHGKRNANNKLGNDMVLVLDTSWSMRFEKLEAMKRAACLVMDKLSELDRLWFTMTFKGQGSDSELRWKLYLVTPATKEDDKQVVRGLTAYENLNIGAGLEEAMKKLRAETLNTSRQPSIMLMSDGKEIIGNASDVSFDSVPVFVLGFGTGQQCNSEILKKIARKSIGGCFYQLTDPNQNEVISNLMDKVLSKHIKDVKLVMIPLKGTVRRGETCTTEIKQVYYAGNYLTSSTNDSDNSVTVSFGSLGKEQCTLLLELFLPNVNKKVPIDSLRLFCLYSDEKGKPMRTNPFIFRVKRNPKPAVTPITETYAKRVEMAKQQLVYNPILPVWHGPYGSQLQQNYRLTLKQGHESIKEVIIIHDFVVVGIGFVKEYQSGSARATTTQMSGGKNQGHQSKIPLGPNEEITMISGVWGKYRSANNILDVICNIRIHTNSCPNGYGPYGQQGDMGGQSSFSTPFQPGGPIVGFFGRANDYLESLGIFVQRAIK